MGPDDRSRTSSSPDGARSAAQQILSLLAARAASSSICPSDAARAMDPGAWRSLMDTVRGAAADLADAGTITVTQGSEVVDVRSARGPIRLRRGPQWPEG